jgi:cyclophilin family peptidyl-prolyl cis-trans isomerase
MASLVGNRNGRWSAWLVVGTLAATLAAIACTGCEKSAPQTEHAGATPTAAVPAKTTNTLVAPAVVRPRLQKAFREAVLLDPPAGQLRPPDRTFAGRDVAQVFEAVAGKSFAGGLWDQVELCDREGRPLKYVAVLDTELGEIHIELLSEAAPHHVTNFIALARAGYYDGLPFHASRREKAGKDMLGYLETGCPKGTGEPGYGSVGYWLEPETESGLLHQAGSVGAFHVVDQSDTAACRFYITLNPMPGMDRVYTIFGKVRRGLDVAETINRRPVVDEDPYDRPQQPVIIRHVTIRLENH